jgi:hypothetical protein
MAIAVLAFAIPAIFSTHLGLPHDLYYLIYVAFVIGALATYVRYVGTDVQAVLRRSWPLSLALGLAIMAFQVPFILGRPATPGPEGPYLTFEVLWRGVVYGAVDALLLSAFPGMVAFGVLQGNLQGVARRAGYFGLALLLSMIITATYHLGYAQYREQGLQQPETGNVILLIPTLVTANPIGSIVAHSAMHVAAVTHVYETDVFLPPQTFAD